MSLARVAFDSNILIYLAGLDHAPADDLKIGESRAIHIKLAESCDCVAPLQAIGELYTVLCRTGVNREMARLRVSEIQSKFETTAATAATFAAAVDLATDHKLQFWDALILATAAHAGCTLLLSEDMQDGFAWQGVTVTNPFAETPHRKLARALQG